MTSSAFSWSTVSGAPVAGSVTCSSCPTNGERAAERQGWSRVERGQRSRSKASQGSNDQLCLQLVNSERGTSGRVADLQKLPCMEKQQKRGGV
jgi:hypothetical protein